MSLLSVEPPPPSAFTVSAKLLVLNAALFHSCASASPGFMRPAASASTPAPLPAFNTSRRLMSTHPPETLTEQTVILPWLERECDEAAADLARRSSGARQ